MGNFSVGGPPDGGEQASGRRKATEAELSRWNGSETLKSQLPLRFEGGITVNEFNGFCACCQARLDSSMIRGKFTWLVDGSVQMSGIGKCTTCKTLVNFEWRIHSDGSLTGISGSRWVRLLPRKVRATDVLPWWARPIAWACYPFVVLWHKVLVGRIDRAR